MTETTSTVILAVDLKVNGRTIPAGSTVELDRTHAANLVHRGMARTPEAPAPAPAADEPAPAGEAATTAAKTHKGKE